MGCLECGPAGMSYYSSFPGLFTKQSSSPPSGPVVMEDFEANPYTGLYTTWVENSTGSTVRSVLHVTQGSFSWNTLGLSSAVIGGIDSDAGDYIDVSSLFASPTQFKIDIFVTTLNASDCIIFGATDNNTAATDYVQSSPGASGAFTLTIPIVNITDFTAIYFFVYAAGSGFTALHGNYNFFMDNLRVS